MRIERHVSFLLIALAAAAVIVGAFTLRDGASKTSAAVQGTATISVVGSPASPVPLATTFSVTDELTAFAPGGLSTGTWGGYNLEMQYDANIISLTSATAGLCGTFWSNPKQGSPASPTLVTGCAFQTSASLGILDHLTFTCNANGISALHLIGISEVNPVKTTNGTALFDENAVNYDTTLVDGSVTCGAGGPTNTPTNTATATDTPVPPTATNTATPTVTNTPCSGPCPTDTATSTATATNTATNTAVPTNTATPSGNVRSATPTPGGATSTASATTAAGTPVPGGTTAPAATATKPGGGAGAGITGPNTGDGGSNGMPGPLSGLWLILGGLGLGALGAGMYLRQRVRRAR